MPDDLKAPNPSDSGPASPDRAEPNRAEGDPQIKVTDRRMFTPDGELREEFRFLDQAEGGSPGEASAATAAAPEPSASPAPSPEQASPEQASREPPFPEPAAPEPEGTPPSRERRPDLPGATGPSTASLMDLVAMLAETAAVYLGDAPLPDGSSGEHLDMARLHIDLLDVLRQKTVGNLTVQESGALEDVLYRLRVRYVQKRG